MINSSVSLVYIADVHFTIANDPLALSTIQTVLNDLNLLFVNNLIAQSNMNLFIISFQSKLLSLWNLTSFDVGLYISIISDGLFVLGFSNDVSITLCCQCSVLM